MNKVISKDGTAIAYDKVGAGPAVILVDGALCRRALGPMPKLAQLLAPHFTVYVYDRRGRGDSGDTPPYAVEREIDDIAALVREAGGTAYIYGGSSGAALALEAANCIPGIVKLAMYEPPFIVDDSRPPITDDYLRMLDDMIAAGRRGDAVKHFMREVGAPAFFIFIMSLTPIWKKLKAIAHTLRYDFAIVKEYERGKPLPAQRWKNVTIPALSIAGEKSPTWMQHAVQAVANVLPNARLRILEGQDHNASAAAVAPVLKNFFAQ